MKQKTKFKETEIGMIPEDWELTSVDEIKSDEKKSIISGPFGSNISSKYFVDFGIPVIRGNNLREDMTKFIDDGFVFVTKEKAKELNTWAKREDIVFTAAGTIGQVGIIPNDSKYEEYIISNKQLRLRVNKKKVLPLFCFYWFSCPFMVRYIQQMNTGSTIPLINLRVLKNLPIPVPSIKEQKSIAKILSDLDAKIELNQQMNQKLESLGQAIFKRWFVDFEFPNEKGKPYKSSGGEMIFNEELGKEIPKDWNVKKIGERLDVILGGTPDRTNKNYWNGDTNWINSGKVNEFRITTPSEKITKEGLKKSATKLLPKGTVVLAITGATLGQVSKLEIDSCANQSVIGILENEELPSEYLYFWIKKMIDDIINWQTGGAQQHINKGNVENSYIIIPPSKIIKEYLKIAKTQFQKISINCFESRNLSIIRDSLLPKLMSGKIRVPVEVRK